MAFFNFGPTLLCHHQIIEKRNGERRLALNFRIRNTEQDGLFARHINHIFKPRLGDSAIGNNALGTKFIGYKRGIHTT